MILLDTSFVVAYYNTRDEHHEKAKEIMQKLKVNMLGECCITDYIFDECMTVILLRLKDIKKATEIGNDLLALTKIIYMDENLFQFTRQIFKEQQKTKLSFTDCSSIALLKDRNMQGIITFDTEFGKVGRINIIN